MLGTEASFSALEGHQARELCSRAVYAADVVAYSLEAVMYESGIGLAPPIRGDPVGHISKVMTMSLLC